MAYDVYACGVVMPVFIGILVKKHRAVESRFACAAIIAGGILGGIASVTGLPLFSYSGMAVASTLVLCGTRKISKTGYREASAYPGRITQLP